MGAVSSGKKAGGRFAPSPRPDDPLTCEQGLEPLQPPTQAEPTDRIGRIAADVVDECDSLIIHYAAWHSHYGDFQRHRAGYLKPDAHAAMRAFHADGMRVALGKMKDGPVAEWLDETVGNMDRLEIEFGQLLYERNSATDTLPMPSFGDRSSTLEMPYEAFDQESIIFQGTPMEELDGVALFLSQDCISSTESAEWVGARDEFLSYYGAYAHRGHEAMELYWCERLVDRFDTLHKTSSKSANKEFYAYGADLLNDLMDTDQYAYASYEWDKPEDGDPASSVALLHMKQSHA